MQQLAGYLRSTSSQIEVAHAFAVQELRSQVNAIREGQYVIPQKPEPPAVVAVEPAPPTMTVFMLKSARFTDHDGRRKFAGQWTDQAMPAALAERALRHGLAVTTAHPMHETHRGMRGADYVADAPDIIDIDLFSDNSGAVCEPPGAQSDPVLIAANFKRIERGGAITGTIPVAKVL
jgi:hypothetical protein